MHIATLKFERSRVFKPVDLYFGHRSILHVPCSLSLFHNSTVVSLLLLDTMYLCFESCKASHLIIKAIVGRRRSTCTRTCRLVSASPRHACLCNGGCRHRLSLLVSGQLAACSPLGCVRVEHAPAALSCDACQISPLSHARENLLVRIMTSPWGCAPENPKKAR